MDSSSHGKIGQDIDWALSTPLQDLLIQGGDARLLVDRNSLLNCYGCQAFPRPGVFGFASSTASTISDEGFAAAGDALVALRLASRTDGVAMAFDQAVERQRRQLANYLGLSGRGVGIVLAASGTDSQLHALFLARAVLGTPLVSVVAGGDETGSGTVFTASGQHFSITASSGASVVKGTAVDGLTGVAPATMVPVRTKGGDLRAEAETDAAVEASVAAAVAQGQKVLLEVMDCSKLGRRSPSLACVQALAARFGSSVKVLIDACQVRLSLSRLRWYLDQGYMVLITGSKFFAGPPYSGALLVPENLTLEAARVSGVPAGMGDYSSRYDWPLAWHGIRAGLPSRGTLGQFLRWAAALREIEAYSTVPCDRRQSVLEQFAATVPAMIASTEGCELLLGSEATIVAFFLKRNGEYLSFEACGKIYRALNRDLASLVPDVQRDLAARRCHIGQPVAVGARGALRISASARMVSETWRDTVSLTTQFDRIQTVMQKVKLIVADYEHLTD